jgi:hypothetical protein
MLEACRIPSMDAGIVVIPACLEHLEIHARALGATQSVYAFTWMR